jgi:hypothetical protein
VAAFPLGQVSAGEHQASVRWHAGNPVWLDFFKVGTPTVMEAEALPFHSEGYPPQLEAAPPRADEPHASENVAVLHRNPGPDWPLQVGLPVSAAGEYRLTLWMNARGRGGHFEFAVNGQPASPPIALPPAPAETVPVDLGRVPLTAGLNTVAIRSDQWFLLDAVEVKP